MRRVFHLTLVLAVIWQLNAASLKPLSLSLGLLSIALVVWLTVRMDARDREMPPIHLTLGLPRYWWWLFTKVLRANIEVAAHAWRPRLAISPATAHIRIGLRSALGKVIYANTVSLSPGTVTMGIEDQTVLVHSLTEKGIDDLRSPEMERRIRPLES